MTVIIEGNETIEEKRKQQAAFEAMKKLKGSGNGNLVSALLKEREKESLL